MYIQQTKLLFLLRSRMVDVKTNFENRYTDALCPVCEDQLDTQQPVLECSVLMQNMNIITNATILHEHIFDSDHKKVTKVTQLFESLWKTRNKELKSRKEPCDHLASDLR